MRHTVANRLFTAAAVIAAIAAASGIPDSVEEGWTAGLVLFLSSVSSAVVLLKRDSTPEAGTVFFVMALAVVSIQFWGGAAGPAGFIYPVLFLWARRDSIAGSALAAASVASVVEFLAPLGAAAGVAEGEFRVVAILDSTGSALIAGMIPVVSLILVDLLREDRAAYSLRTTPEKKQESKTPSFPDDVARSLLPVIAATTSAGGVFFFRNDERGVFTLDEYVAGKHAVASRYLAGADDPVVAILNNSSSDLIHTSADKLAVADCSGLPWYIRESGCPFVTLLGFRREGRLHGFFVVDFAAEKERDAASQILVDSAFLLAVAWERSRETGSYGFLEICEQMSAASGTRSAVHRIIRTVLQIYPDTTATVALIGEGSVLRIFESIGPCGEGRAGREFGLYDGFAGFAVKKKEPLRRLRMGAGQKASGTFGVSDSSGRQAGSCCAIPLLNMGTVIGVLTVESENEQFFAPEDLSLFTAFATVFSLAVSRNGLMERLDALKKSDRITGLPRLSRFHEGLADMVREVQNKAVSVTVFAVDIHDFKGINRTWGFQAGDSVLEETAVRIRKAVGREALLARSGADEFLVCLQGVDRVSAEAYAARIHEKFDSPVFFRSREIAVKVTIGGAVSHVDSMIRRLPDIASDISEKISEKPEFSLIDEVGQFYSLEKE
ncbi:hypothetical protein CSA37_11940 [Candidatus Fermentibacteria bacterium]|nr:MAG: hypothetical protein CSA37_11940 [Candidatus Fermentibacteria bacterium]